MKQRIQLSDHFTFSRLIRFVLPSIAMMLCTSLYSIVDGFFVSNYVGKTLFCCGQSYDAGAYGGGCGRLYDRYGRHGYCSAHAR